MGQCGIWACKICSDYHKLIYRLLTLISIGWVLCQLPIGSLLAPYWALWNLVLVGDAMGSGASSAVRAAAKYAVDAEVWNGDAIGSL